MSLSLLFHIDYVHFLSSDFIFMLISLNLPPTVLHQGPKCPSGCRIEGLMNKYDHSLLKRIEKIRSLLDENTVKQRSTDSATKQTYDYLKDKLTTDAGESFHTSLSSSTLA